MDPYLSGRDGYLRGPHTPINYTGPDMVREGAVESKLNDATIFQQRKRIEELEEELRACKEFFGYNADMTLQEMRSHKDECDEEEKACRQNDQEYADRRDRSDQLADLVVELGEHQYAVAGLYAKIKKLSSEQTTGLRKSFSSDFAALKGVVDEEHIDEFFDIMHKWLSLQRSIHYIDRKIINTNLK